MRRTGRREGVVGRNSGSAGGGSAHREGWRLRERSDREGSVDHWTDDAAGMLLGCSWGSVPKGVNGSMRSGVKMMDSDEGTLAECHRCCYWRAATGDALLGGSQATRGRRLLLPATVLSPIASSFRGHNVLHKAPSLLCSYHHIPPPSPPTPPITSPLHYGKHSQFQRLRGLAPTHQRRKYISTRRIFHHRKHNLRHRPPQDLSQSQYYYNQPPRLLYFSPLSSPLKSPTDEPQTFLPSPPGLTSLPQVPAQKSARSVS